MSEEPTFQDLLFMMGPASANVFFEPDFFNAALKRLYDRFDVEFDRVQDAFDHLNRTLPGVGGRYRIDATEIDRKSLVRMLCHLSKSARVTIRALEGFSGGAAVWRDKRTTLAREPLTYAEYFAASVPLVRDPDMYPWQVDAALTDAINSLARIVDYADAVLMGIEEVPSKPGQRGLGWYDDFVKEMIEAATLLGIPISTRDPGSSVTEGTLFTCFVREFEALFLAKDQSPSAGACAKRIERSRAHLRKGQQNSA